jgi:tetratricopeptide (TPR) repeat protein
MRILLAVLLFLSVVLSVSGQNAKKQEAKEYFFHQKYADALAVLSNARDIVRYDDESKFLLAICHYQLNQLDKANLLFKELSRSNKSPYPECWLYLGKIHHAMHQFEKAAGYYKDYLRRIKSNHPNRVMVWDAIQRCGNGIRLQYKNAGAVVENLGAGINSEHDEFAPIVSPNFSNKLYFSSIRPGNFGGARNDQGLPDARLGQYRSDIYSSSRTNNQWTNVKAMHYLLNSPQHEVLLDFSADGSVLYYFKGWSPEQGQIYVDTFKTIDNRQLSSDPFRGVINARIGDSRPYFVNDTLVYFSSRRPGGYGGLDLYSASFSNGTWGKAKNLGATINSSYDETTPFLARDGRTLYFSSNNSMYSMGGLDVLKTVYNEQSKRWTIPENIGTPINSSADESGFRIAKDGFTAYFSSARKDGMGKRDLYAAYFSNFLPEMELPIAYVPVSVPVQVPTTTYVKEEVGRCSRRI